MPRGEFDLIEAIKERLPAEGPRLRVGSGDDAAVVETEGRANAVTIDAQVEGVHFTLPEFPPEAIGRKALAAALSDLAAMGAEPGEAYVSLGAPAEAGDELLLGIADGLAEVAAREDVSIAGGDLVGAPLLVLSVTAIGYETGDAPLVTRAGAKPGDAIVVTGELGGAAAALALLEPDGEDRELSDSAREAILARQLDPRPNLEAGAALARAGATSMIDLSDGLGTDAAHLARAGGCRLRIETEKVPVADGVASIAEGERDALELAVSGGEDFELLATLPTERVSDARKAVSASGSTLTEIGYAIEGEGLALRLPDGEELEPRGFDHRRESASGPGSGSSSG